MPCDTTNMMLTGTPCALSKQRLGSPVTKNGFYEEVEHTADLALRFGGPDLESFFCSAARGMYHLLGAETTPSEDTEQHTISLEANDLESLLVDWLGELAYLAETAGLVFGEIAFKTLTATRIEAILTGSRMYRLEKVIKAVTYHNLNVIKTGDGYAATVVFDV